MSLKIVYSATLHSALLKVTHRANGVRKKQINDKGKSHCLKTRGNKFFQPKHSIFLNGVHDAGISRK